MVTFGRFAAFSLLVSIATASHVVISTIGTGTGIAEGVPRYLTTSPHQARRSRIQPCTDITSLSLTATSTHNDLPTSHSDSYKPQLTISVQENHQNGLHQSHRHLPLRRTRPNHTRPRPRHLRQSTPQASRPTRAPTPQLPHLQRNLRGLRRSRCARFHVLAPCLCVEP